MVWSSTGLSAQYPFGPQVAKDGTAVLLQDYVSLPASSRTSGSYPPPIDFADQLGRVNFLRSEPADAPESPVRFFVNDLNRNLYILEKASRTFTPYINFEEVFPKFDNRPGYAGGLVTFAFDPDYAGNGKLYSVHTEDPNEAGSAVPTNASLPGLDLSGGYTVTAPINPPAGAVAREAVLVEWTDANRNNLTFEGTAREILRVGFNTDIHPIGDLLFNPLAQSGHADHRNLYISVGDGGAGELAGVTHAIPQRLDALQGKVLRITPDLALRPDDLLSPNGRYRIPTTGPDANPFAALSLANLRKEIYAYGFRNPHRMLWDPFSDKPLVMDIGLNAWEEVNILTKGSNYGYAEREGTEQLFVGGTNDGKTGGQTVPPTPFPDPDLLTVTGIATPITPLYPAAQYSHEDGDAISSGFVYRGSLMPELAGKYVFADISTARLFFADLADLMVNDDGNRTTLAAVHELQVVFDSPHDSPDQGAVNRRLFDIVADQYANRGGDAPGSRVLPGGATVTGGNDPDGIPYGGGRADIRLALGGDDEIYILSKSDGMIRQLVAVVGTGGSPTVVTATPATVPAGDLATATWSGITNPTGTDWVGLYTPTGTDAAFINWRYVNCSQVAGSAAAAGSCAFPTTALAAGAYQFRLFRSDGYSKLATSNDFTVASGSTTLTANPLTVPAGSPVTATWDGIASPAARDWIGLYLTTAPDLTFIDWRYVSCSQVPGSPAAGGSCAMPILATLAPGTYQLRLLRDDGYEKLATSNNFTVTGQSTPTVAASPSTLTTGSPVTATWSGIASPAARDWIGIYTTAAGDQSFIDWRYVSCLQTPGSAAAAGACAFPTTGLGTGNYQFRLFRDDGFTKLATSNTFTVTSGLQAAGSVLEALSDFGPAECVWRGE